MGDLDDRLYHACLSFCREYTHLLSNILDYEFTKRHFWNNEIKEKEIEMAKHELRRRVQIIKEIIEEIDKGIEK